eukprot:2500478-Pyramimonas_sp.AAC.1
MFILSRRKLFAKVGVYFETIRTPWRRLAPTLKLEPGGGRASTIMHPSLVCRVLNSLLLEWHSVFVPAAAAQPQRGRGN